MLIKPRRFESDALRTFRWNSAVAHMLENVFPSYEVHNPRVTAFGQDFSRGLLAADGFFLTPIIACGAHKAANALPPLVAASALFGCRLDDNVKFSDHWFDLGFSFARVVREKNEIDLSNLLMHSNELFLLDDEHWGLRWELVNNGCAVNVNLCPQAIRS